MKPIGIVGRRFLLLSLLAAASVGSAGFAASLTPAESQDYQTADGLTAYIGIVPAEVVREEHPEMHRGVPTRSNEYHFVVAIFDSNTGERVTDATVSTIVYGPGNTVVYGQRHLSPWGTRPLSETLPRTPLEPMAIAQTTTYGGFFVLLEPTKYTFQLTITRPGRTRPTVMNFVHDHHVG